MDIKSMDKNIIRIAVLSATTGFLIGYALGKRKKQDDFDRAVDEACAETRELYRQRRIEFEERVAEANQVACEEHAIVEEAASALATYQGVEPLEENESELTDQQAYDHIDSGITPVSVPESPSASKPEHKVESVEWAPPPIPVAVPQDFMRKPVPPKPKPSLSGPYVDRSKAYVVSVEEFLQNENDWAQETLTYYEGDDTLVDERETIMDDRSRMVTVGTCLSEFGEQSKDPNAVYIKNEKLKIYIEIVKDGAMYKTKVAGLGENE